MVGGDAIAKNTEWFRIDDFLDVARRWREGIEEGRLLNVGRLTIPLIDITGGGLDVVPLRILIREACVAILENIGRERLTSRLFDFRSAGPDIGQVDWLTRG